MTVTSDGGRNGVTSGNGHLGDFWVAGNVLFLCVGAEKHGSLLYKKYKSKNITRKGQIVHNFFKMLYKGYKRSYVLTKINHLKLET